MINHDESTYIVIGDAIRHGYVYWVDVVDTKPLGIFLIYAFLEFIFGDAIFLYRLFAALVVATTAFALFRAKRNLGSNFIAARSAGVIFIFLCSIFTYYGVSPNTETFFVGLTAVSLWLLTGRGYGVLRFFIGGFLLGFGLIVKYVVLMDVIAIGLLLLSMEGRKQLLSWRYLALMIGGLLPIGSVVVYYYLQGEMDTFLFYTLEVSKRYPSEKNWFDYLKSSIDFFLRFLPVSLLVWSVYSRRIDFPWKYWGLLWMAVVLFIILVPGTFFGHYYIQLMLPFSFLAGEAVAQSEKLPDWQRWFFRPRPGAIFLVLISLANLFFQKKDYIDRVDAPREIANYLKPKLTEGEEVYVVNQGHIIYHLLDLNSPLTYVHPSLFWKEEHVSALNIPVEKELNRLFQSPPRFIVMKDGDQRVEGRLEFWRWFTQKYKKKASFEELHVYEIMGSPYGKSLR